MTAPEKRQAEIDAGKWIRATCKHYWMPEEFEVHRDDPDFVNRLRQVLTEEVFRWVVSDLVARRDVLVRHHLAADLVEFAIYHYQDQGADWDDVINCCALDTLDQVCGPESELGDEPDLDELREKVWPGYHERGQMSAEGPEQRQADRARIKELRDSLEDPTPEQIAEQLELNIYRVEAHLTEINSGDRVHRVEKILAGLDGTPPEHDEMLAVLDELDRRHRRRSSWSLYDVQRDEVLEVIAKRRRRPTLGAAEDAS